MSMLSIMDTSEYPIGFFDWLDFNQDLYDDFVMKSLQMAQRRKHYSARAILHAIRWETDLRDSDVTFKCNNNWTPGMARLFMEDHPEHRGFFRCRDSQGLG